MSSSSSSVNTPPVQHSNEPNVESDPATEPFLRAMQESQNYPDLMQPDPLMDFALTHRFPPSRRSPYPSQLIVRNEPSMFLTLQDDLKAMQSELDSDPDSAPTNTTADPNESDNDADTHNPMRFLHLSPSEIQKLFQYRMASSRVTQQTGKGKVYRFSILTVVGNGDGLVGYGEGKDEEMPRAATKALIAAVRNMDHVARFEDRTLYTEMSAKFGSTRLFVRPRPVGFGLHCNPNVHQVFKAAGIKDASAKVWGSRNPRRVIKALFQMLHPSHMPIVMGNGVGGPGRRLDKGYGARTREEVERERGRPLVALRT